MAQDAVRSRNVSIRFACQLFVVSESCYRYQPQLNEEISYQMVAPSVY
jgi:putative transposase